MNTDSQWLKFKRRKKIIKNTKLSIIFRMSFVASLSIDTYIGNTNSCFTTTVTTEIDSYIENRLYIVGSYADPSDDLCADGYGDETNRSTKPLDSFIAIDNAFLAIQQRQLFLI